MVVDLNRDLLVKLLGMIGSTFDAEALQAARRANDLVRGECCSRVGLYANDFGHCVAVSAGE